MMPPQGGADPALVLLDALRSGPTPGRPEPGEALAAARAAGARVVHVWTADPSGPPPDVDPALAPRPGEPVLPNQGPDAWVGSDLAATLAAVGAGEAVVAGPGAGPAWAGTLAGVPAGVRLRPVAAADLAAWAAPTPAGAVAPADGPPREGGRSRRRLLAVLLVVLALVAGGVAAAFHGAHRYYEFAPGDAPTVTASPRCVLRSGDPALTLPDGSPCARLIVPPSRTHGVEGRLLMVDVLVGPATPEDWVLSELHLLGAVHPSTQLVPASEVLGSTPPSQLGCQDAAQMQGSTEAAAVAALDRLGYRATPERLGARVVQVAGSSAASAAGVRCNDVVTALDATPVRSAADLVAAVHGHRPGQQVALTVRRTTGTGTSTLTLHATLTATPARPGGNGVPVPPPAPSAAFLGVATDDDTAYRLPFPVSIQVGDIGGPSAGLALTLGLLDVLSDGHLTGGHTVAATGTIAPDGTVGDVGGVAQKTVAVHDAGAQLFLVPPQELAVARAHAGGMRVEAVGTLDQALAYLRAMGGTVPAPAAG